MLDKEILDELLKAKKCLEENIYQCKMKLEYYQKELAKSNRLIEVFQKRNEQLK